eukprot:m.110721 g.110721  ORF g.110721 m.110721 type:complete len:533 (-) comp15925_c0_seq1:253-1851(-)
MSAKGSSWTKSPGRGLTDPIMKNADEPDDPEATFAPNVNLSNPKLRQKVYSSSYGVVSPKEYKPKPTIDPEEAEADPEATFAPNLEMSDPSIRAKARSSGYGINIPAKKELEQPLPTFTPEVTKTELAESLRARARSSGYGKVAARPTSAEPPTPDRDAFKPQLPADRIREAAPSSGYAGGYTPPVNKSRRESVEASSGERVLRHSLLKDKPKPEELEDKTDNGNSNRAFVLDGVKVALTNVTLVKKGVSTAKLAEVLPPPPRSETAKQLKDRVHTQGYGKETYTPPRGQKVEKAESPSFRFGAAPTDEPRQLPETPEAVAIREQARKNARSQGYGASFVPPKGEKAVKEEEPKFKFTKGSVLEEARKDPPKSIEEYATYGLPKTARASSDGDTVKAKARAAGYGTKDYQPPKGEKKEVVSMPGFVPGGRRSSVKQLTELEPAPKSSLNDRVESAGYGRVPVKTKRTSDGGEPHKAARGSRSVSATSPSSRSNRSNNRSATASVEASGSVHDDEAGAADASTGNGAGEFESY